MIIPRSIHVAANGIILLFLMNNMEVPLKTKYKEGCRRGDQDGEYM